MVKQIHNFNYMVSDCGEIISLNINKPICQWVDNVGYLQVNLMKEGKKYYKRVHRIVAETFIPNPKNLPQVNHKDGNKKNNSVENLEWVDNKNNTIHGYENDLYHSKKRAIKIEVYSKSGEYINAYNSIRETAHELNINRKTLSRILFDNKENNYIFDFKAIL